MVEIECERAIEFVAENAEEDAILVSLHCNRFVQTDFDYVATTS